MTAEEREWLNLYHARVRDSLSHLVDEPTRAWLERATVAV
jgi:Xaa-Pro aminopeptidase